MGLRPVRAGMKMKYGGPAPALMLPDERIDQAVSKGSVRRVTSSSCPIRRLWPKRRQTGYRRACAPILTSAREYYFSPASAR